jgi:hypothetical protein
VRCFEIWGWDPEMSGLDLPQRTGGRAGMVGEDGEPLVVGVVELKVVSDIGKSSLPVSSGGWDCDNMMVRLICGYLDISHLSASF